MSGKKIDLTADNIAIESDNFKVDKTGKVTATSGTIGGYDLGIDNLSAELYTDYDYTKEDVDKAVSYSKGEIELTKEEFEKLDVDKNGKITSMDVAYMNNVVNGRGHTITNSNRGKLTIRKKDPFNSITLTDGNDEVVTRIGIRGIDTNSIRADSINNVNIKEQKILWENFYYMNGSQSIVLNEKVSEQTNGIVLVWSGYKDGEPQNYNFNHFFIPKSFVNEKGGYGTTMIMSGGGFDVLGCKYVYISDDRITGNDTNTLNSTKNGITFNNKSFVLRYVIGV